MKQRRRRKSPLDEKGRYYFKIFGNQKILYKVLKESNWWSKVAEIIWSKLAKELQIKFTQLNIACILVFGSISVQHLQCQQYCSNCVWLKSNKVLSNLNGVSLNFPNNNMHNQHHLYANLGGGHTVFNFHLPIYFITTLHYLTGFDFLVFTVGVRNV